MYFVLDIDDQSYLVTEKSPKQRIMEEESGEAESKEQETLQLPESIIVYEAENSLKKVVSEKIEFRFFSDGTREFGLIYVEDIDKRERYTLFLNPYTEKTKVFKGEISFNEQLELI